MSATLIEDPAVENPRWTRCAYAIGRRPTSIEFMIWNERCWAEFAAMYGVKSWLDRQQKLWAILKEDCTRAGGPFDIWQREQVLAGRWKDLP